jgi:pyruvyltransferase
MRDRAGDLGGMLRLPGGARVRDKLLRIPGVFPGRPRAHWFIAVPNLGDQISPFLLERLLGARPVWASRRYRGKILSTGSILRSLAARDVVWGSGLISDILLSPPRGVKFLAVRGPLTRQRIAADVPAVYGDPAILLPWFYQPNADRKHAIGVVPHYVDYRAVRDLNRGLFVIDVRRPWQEVVQDICSCDAIVSSSLHGLIVAEAYGVPASWIRISDRITGGTFKFDDYYVSTQREQRPPVEWKDGSGIDEALRRVPERPQLEIEPLVRAAASLGRTVSNPEAGED